MVLAPRSVVVFSGAKILAKLSMMSWHEVCVLRTVWYRLIFVIVNLGVLKVLTLLLKVCDNELSSE